MPVTANETKRLSDLLKVQDYPLYQAGYSTEFVTVNEATARTLEIGDLVGQVTADDKYKFAVNTASDGSETIAGVVVERKEIPATTDTQVEVIVRGALIIADLALNTAQVTQYTLPTIKTALEGFHPPVLVGDQL